MQRPRRASLPYCQCCRRENDVWCGKPVVNIDRFVLLFRNRDESIATAVNRSLVYDPNLVMFCYNLYCPVSLFLRSSRVIINYWHMNYFKNWRIWSIGKHCCWQEFTKYRSRDSILYNFYFLCVNCSKYYIIILINYIFTQRYLISKGNPNPEFDPVQN